MPNHPSHPGADHSNIPPGIVKSLSPSEKPTESESSQGLIQHYLNLAETALKAHQNATNPGRDK